MIFDRRQFLASLVAGSAWLIGRQPENRLEACDAVPASVEDVFPRYGQRITMDAANLMGKLVLADGRESHGFLCGSFRYEAYRYQRFVRHVWSASQPIICEQRIGDDYKVEATLTDVVSPLSHGLLDLLMGSKREDGTYSVSPSVFCFKPEKSFAGWICLPCCYCDQLGFAVKVRDFHVIQHGHALSFGRPFFRPDNAKPEHAATCGLVDGFDRPILFPGDPDCPGFAYRLSDGEMKLLGVQQSYSPEARVVR